MDFSNRSAQPQAPTPQPANTGNTNLRRNKKSGGDWSRIGITAIVAAVAILLIAVAFVAASGNNVKSQSTYVDSKRLQAVFLNTGQVYFGNIKSLNNKYLVLTNIYYLQTSNQNSGSNNSNPNVTLVKLGCELHEPYDQMVINSDQITFWENLQDNGQVAKAVSTFEKQNPQGQKCADQSTSSSSNSGNSVQSAGNSNNGSTNNNSSR